MSEKKTYLGDSVYYDMNSYSIILTTENGVSASNTIIIDNNDLGKLLDVLCRDYGADKIRALCVEIEDAQELSSDAEKSG